MKNVGIVLLVLAPLAGCQTHAVFCEASHTGLLVEFNSTGTAPVNLDLGYERGTVILLPQRLKDGVGAITECGDKITIWPGKGELTSLYSTYEANIGWRDPFEVEHFLATGIAAANVVADPDTLKYLDKQPAAQTAKPEK